MVNPTTVNAGIIIPNTGADVGTWGSADVNPNMVALDGYLCGVQTIGLTNAPVTLSAPAGFIPTPSPGPTQSQNRVLKFTGLISANIVVTLPLPGCYVIDNQTTGNFVLNVVGSALAEYVAVDQGARRTVYNDGSRVRFVDMEEVGTLKFLAGRNAIPLWINACSPVPYLLCDSTLHNIADFPYLAGIMGTLFGGNGVTTFGVPDLSGRVPLAYDVTGTRITAGGGAGFNGQQIGASGGVQGSQLATPNLPAYTPAGTITNGAITPQGGDKVGTATGGANSGSSFTIPNQATTLTISQAASTFTGTPQGGTAQVFSNVQPAQVAGIWVIKT